MNYILITDGAINKFPYSLGELRRDNPQVSFPASPDVETLTGFGVFLVQATAPPANTATQKPVEGTPVLFNGTWQQARDMVDFSQGELSQIALENARRITRLAFRNRFTTPEKVALEIAGLDDPAAPMPARAQAAALRANQADLAAATFVDLDRPDTRAGVQMLEAAGLLAAGRALVILDAPVTTEERPLA